MTNIHSALFSLVGKHILGIIGASIAVIKPTFPFILVCTLAVLADCYTAWALSRRVKKRFPQANDGKFKSSYAGRVFVTLIKIYTLTILVHLIDVIVFSEVSLHLPQIVAGMVCFWQIWSMLENESSCNDAKWAKIAQRIMVDKTERHFDIDLHELKEEEEKVCDNEMCAYNGKVKCDVNKCTSYIQPKN